MVAGAGNSAGQAAMFLAENAEKVLLVVRGEGLTKSVSNYLSRRVEAKENIEILTHTEIRRMMGDKSLEAIELENTKTGEKRTVQVSAVFSMIGAKPKAVLGLRQLLGKEFITVTLDGLPGRVIYRRRPPPIKL